MKNELSVNVSSIFNIAKVLAILSVILAHSRVNDSTIYSTLAEIIGAIGVVTFFFISGYFYNGSKYGISVFFLKKIKTIIIPWIFLGSVVFFVGNKFSFLNYANWLIGNGTYLYYLSVLMMCYLLSSFFKQQWHRFFFILLNIISLLLTSFGVIDQIWGNVLDFTPFNNYLNIFNWIGFFSLGILFQGKMQHLLFILNKNIVSILILYVIVVFFSLLFEPNAGGYFSIFAIPLEITGLLALFSLSTLPVFHQKIIYKISEFTFTVYLIHFLVFPFRRFLISNYFFQFLNPVVYLLICIGLILIGKYVSKKIKMESLFTTLMGVR